MFTITIIRITSVFLRVFAAVFVINMRNTKTSAVCGGGLVRPVRFEKCLFNARAATRIIYRRVSRARFLNGRVSKISNSKTSVSNSQLYV